MKILYAVQATGNGHISRAMELLPHLKRYGQVDIFLSGNNSHLRLDAPVTYRSKGLSLYYKGTGSLNYWQMMRELKPLRIRKEIMELPVEKYDLVLNDFEHITAAACSRKGVHSVNFGHQASFASPFSPRPLQKSMIGEFVLKNYAKADRYLGLHFKKYDDFIFTPVIKKKIREAVPVDLQYVTVYLPSWSEAQLIQIFSAYKDIPFEVFCHEVKEIKRFSNLTLLPVDGDLFNQSLIYCTGIITGGGFETPAEALHLGKKIMTIPIKNQYEQQCNAAALAEMAITRLNAIDNNFKEHLYTWMNEGKVLQMDYSNSIGESLDHLFNPPVANNRYLRELIAVN
ncbi:MAG: glycosyl transferase [Chitinophagaceae bacterium]|nr:MAG: glycosyl transferase [Chitinophagaceae bacterium]